METETVLSITASGVISIGAMAQLVAKCGPCAGNTHFGAVTLFASRSNKQTTTRYFELPRDLATALASGPPCYIAPGVHVGTAKVDPGQFRLEGPGSAMWQAIRQTSGVRNRVPELPAAWLAAIRAAI